MANEELSYVPSQEDASLEQPAPAEALEKRRPPLFSKLRKVLAGAVVLGMFAGGAIAEKQNGHMEVNSSKRMEMTLGATAVEEQQGDERKTERAEQIKNELTALQRQYEQLVMGANALVAMDMSDGGVRSGFEEHMKMMARVSEEMNVLQDELVGLQGKGEVRSAQTGQSDNRG